MADDIESKARQEGWKPLEEFVEEGKPEAQWVDAETFVSRGKDINAILRKNNARLERELAAVRASADETSMTVKQLQEHNAKIEKSAYDRALRELKQERRAAVAAGEHEAAAELDDQIDALKEAPPEPPKAAVQEPAKPQLDPIIQEWVADNSDWFNEDNPDLVGYANGVGTKLRRNNPALKGEKFLDTIKKEVIKMFPDRFPSAEEGESGSPVESGTSTPSPRVRGKTLPPEAMKEKTKLCGEKWYQDLAKSAGKTPQKMFDDDYFGSN